MLFYTYANPAASQNRNFSENYGKKSGFLHNHMEKAAVK